MPPLPEEDDEGLDDDEGPGRRASGTASSAWRSLRRKETSPRLRLRSSSRKRGSVTGRGTGASCAVARREFRRCAKRMAPKIRRTPFELCTPWRTCRYSASSSAKGTSAAGVGTRRTTLRRSTGRCCGESMYLMTVLAYMNCPAARCTSACTICGDGHAGGI